MVDGAVLWTLPLFDMETSYANGRSEGPYESRYSLFAHSLCTRQFTINSKKSAVLTVPTDMTMLLPSILSAKI